MGDVLATYGIGGSARLAIGYAPVAATRLPSARRAANIPVAATRRPSGKRYAASAWHPHGKHVTAPVWQARHGARTASATRHPYGKHVTEPAW